jgi:hypothetical protein
MNNKKNKQKNVKLKEAQNTKKELNNSEALSDSNLKPWHIFAFVGSVALLIISLYCINNYKSYARDKVTMQELNMDYIYFNVFASDIQLGGLTKEQAKNKLEKELNEDELFGRTLHLSSTNMAYSRDFTFEELGATYNIDELVEDAYNYGRTGSVKERLATIRQLDDNVGKFIGPQIIYDKEKLRELVLSIEDDVNSKLTSGKKLDVDRAVDMIEQQLMLNISGSTIYLPEK